MKLNITIKTDNAAFDDGNSGAETARILRELADELDGADLQDSGVDATLRDINGNAVDSAKTTGR